MGSDAQWQDENGFSREVRGDFSAPQYDSTGDNIRHYIAHFCTFEAAAMLAKAFPGSTVKHTDVTRRRRGQIVTLYEVNTFEAHNHPDPAERERYAREYYAIKRAATEQDMKL